MNAGFSFLPVFSAVFFAPRSDACRLQADELPMIYGTLVFIYCVKEHGNRTPKQPMLLPLLLLAAAAVSALSV
jgi:hypothetical protein